MSALDAAAVAYGQRDRNHARDVLPPNGCPSCRDGAAAVVRAYLDALDPSEIVRQFDGHWPPPGTVLKAVRP